jgi:hypothetical protein
VFDVIGPVSSPIYCIRFNSHEDIEEKGIKIGDKAFCAPRTEYTSFVILSNIMGKGSDASWKNDIEPPDNLVEYSDDEQERNAKRQNRSNNQARRRLPQNQQPQDNANPPHHNPHYQHPNNYQRQQNSNYSWHNQIQQ